MEIKRRNTRRVAVGNIVIGGGAPISVQSMTNKPASDFEATISQIQDLSDAGCDIVRVAVPDVSCAAIFSAAREKGIKCPLVADIHFNYRIALEAIRHGVDKVRINPGNIGEKWKINEVASACKSAGVPIRIGVNGGSLDKKILQKYGSPTAEALAESALSEAELLEDCGFSDIVISIKSSSIYGMTNAARIVAGASDYPLHLGVTEAGDAYSGTVKNSIGIGSLLLDGIGDTIRVSLTADPTEEIRAAREILSSLKLDPSGGIEVVSCPTCGRTKIDLIGIGSKYKKAVQGIKTNGKHLKVAIMGCVVNGPGEAREADFGIAGGDGYVLFFKNGEPQFKVEQSRAVDILIEETNRMLGETKNLE